MEKKQDPVSSPCRIGVAYDSVYFNRKGAFADGRLSRARAYVELGTIRPSS